MPSPRTNYCSMWNTSTLFALLRRAAHRIISLVAILSQCQIAGDGRTAWA
jgi:hypothetical protein